MDLFTVPDPSEAGMGYAYIIMMFVFIFASFTVYKLKQATKKADFDKRPKQYDLYEPDEKKK